MSERKIIINDIDIANCKFWKGYCRIGSLCDYARHLCEVKSDCYYKQLKRKEQECEKYKQALNDILSIATNSDMLPCADFEVDCTKCKDRITEKGKRCMRYGLIKIKNVVEKAKDGK